MPLERLCEGDLVSCGLLVCCRRLRACRNAGRSIDSAAEATADLRGQRLVDQRRRGQRDEEGAETRAGGRKHQRSIQL